jgi:hypothetical protein
MQSTDERVHESRSENKQRKQTKASVSLDCQVGLTILCNENVYQFEKPKLYIYNLSVVDGSSNHYDHRALSVVAVADSNVHHMKAKQTV